LALNNYEIASPFEGGLRGMATPLDLPSRGEVKNIEKLIIKRL
jgi:hypothetical protein